jgi:hypothetical protein
MTKRDAIYGRFEAFEEQLAHCYFLLQERFIADPALSRFWADSALEELQHNSILRFCRERGFMADVEVDGKTADKVEELLDTVKTIVSDPDVSIDEAFYASLLMESSALEEAYAKLTRALEKDHLLLYAAIHASLRSHHDRFTEAAEAFCSNRGIVEGFRNLGRGV